MPMLLLLVRHARRNNGDNMDKKYEVTIECEDKERAVALRYWLISAGIPENIILNEIREE